MDINANLILMDYFENAAKLKPGEFVLLRDGKVIDPLIHGKFTKEHPATIRMSDSQEILAGDTLQSVQTHTAPKLSAIIFLTP